jgi:hypothetical protein
MASNKLTKNYSPNIYYKKEYSIDHIENDRYVTSLAMWGMGRIRTSAKPYAGKHPGVKDTGKPGKKVTVTLDELKKIIINSNGKSPDGTNIYFAPIGILNAPTRAKELGLLTEDEHNRFPSFDRIVSSLKEYSFSNIQLSTLTYNRVKGERNILPTYTDKEVISVRLEYKGVKMETEMTSSFFANMVKDLVN